MSDPGAPTGGPHASIRPHRGPNPYATPGSAGRANVPQPPAPTRRSRWIDVPRVLLVLAIVGVALAGGLAFFRSSPPATPGEVVTSFIEAASTADIDGVCDQLSRATLDQIEARGQSCEDGFEQVIADTQRAGDDGGEGIFGTADSGRAPKVEVLKEEVDGDRADVTVRIDGEGPDPDGPIPLVREDGHWKVDFSNR